MARIAIPVLLITSAFALVAFADDEPSFSFTPEQLMALYNGHTAEGDDRVVTVKKANEHVRLVMDDKYFKIGIAKMKDMDIVNGKFTMDINITMTLDRKGFVKTIAVFGTRGDPVNLFRTIGSITILYEILNPGVPPETANNFMMALGLMRGDSDPTINTPITKLSKGGVFTCNNQDSDTSIKFGCVIIPRS